MVISPAVWNLSSLSRQQLIERNYGFDFVIFYFHAAADVSFLSLLLKPSIFSSSAVINRSKQCAFFCRKCHHLLLTTNTVTGETCPAGVYFNLLHRIPSTDLPPALRHRPVSKLSRGIPSVTCLRRFKNVTIKRSHKADQPTKPPKLAEQTE